MSKTVLTPAKEKFIRENYLTMSGTAISKKLGISKSVVNVYKRKNNLKVDWEQVVKWRTEKNRGRTTFTTKEDNYIRNNYLLKPIKTIAKDLGRSGCGVNGRLKKMGLEVPEDVKQEMRERGYIKKGTVPHSKGKKMSDYLTPEQIAKVKKTQFKKGRLPHNTLSDGTISIRNRKGVKLKYIRISLANWIPLHRKIWQDHHGEITKGDNIIFRDGDTMNCDISNLMKLSNAELAVNNSWWKYPPELRDIIKLNNRLIKTIKKSKKCHVTQ